MSRKISGILSNTLIIGFLLIVCLSINANKYKAVIAKLPTSDNYVALLAAIGEETNNKFTTEILPMSRTVYLMEGGQADLQCPQIIFTDPKKIADLKYDYSTPVIYKLGFVLYTNKKKPVTVAELKKGNPKNYIFETKVSHTVYFDFKCVGSTNIEASLKKVDNGTIDGFISAMTSSDKLLKQLKLTNVKRELFDFFTNKFLIPKGAKGKEVDKILIDGFKKIKANGKYDKIMGDLVKVAEKYDDWQP